jgi:hypothetical protein
MRSCARPLTARLGKGSCSRAIRRESLFLFQEISSQSPLLAQSGHSDLPVIVRMKRGNQCNISKHSTASLNGSAR